LGIGDWGRGMGIGDWGLGIGEGGAPAPGGSGDKGNGEWGLGIGGYLFMALHKYGMIVNLWDGRLARKSEFLGRAGCPPHNIHSIIQQHLTYYLLPITHYPCKIIPAFAEVV
jgi:hypothetical protein